MPGPLDNLARHTCTAAAPDPEKVLHPESRPVGDHMLAALYAGFGYVRCPHCGTSRRVVLAGERGCRGG